jgi:hypothetical protein
VLNRAHIQVNPYASYWGCSESDLNCTDIWKAKNGKMDEKRGELKSNERKEIN